jgi:PKD repeat protein
MRVTPDSYSVQLSGWYYAPNLYQSFWLYKATALNITQDTSITFTLQNRFLTGKVDCEGKPVANVSIEVRGWTYFDDLSGEFYASTITDNEGKFNVTVFTSTSVSIRATPPPESIYAPASITNVDVTDDKMVLIALFYKAGVLPTANFTWSPEIPEVGQTVTFDASTSIPGSGIIIRHKWSFGDGTYAIGKIVTHSYATPGVYTVTLNVTNSKGLWDIEQKQITIVEIGPGPKPPVASFTFSPANPKVDKGATLDASTSFDPDGQIVSYIWNFGDGFTGEGKIATHSYSKEGNYKVTLTVVDNDGKSSITSQTVTVVKPTTPTIQTSGLVVIAKSPVDLVIIDPDYFVISKEYSEIPDAVYMEEDLNGDGSLDVYVIIPERKIGQYSITVIPKPDADPSDTYTLEVSSDNIAFLIGENVPISDIPSEPYVLYSTTFEAPPLPTYALTITTTVGGTTDPAVGTYTYTVNSSVQVTAIPNVDYAFDHWELDIINVGSANPYTVLMDNNHTLRAVFTYSPPPPSLSASISPLSASILVGQSLTFTSTVSGGYTPYTYQWYLNGYPVSGATSNTWAFTPTSSGIYYVYLKVTDYKGNIAQSETARITVATVPVGGYSIPIQLPATAKPATIHIALLTILTAIFITIKRKTKRKH